MKKIVYTSFASKERITVESTKYKDSWGKVVWVDEKGMTYELNFARLAKVWAATKTMSLDEGIEKGLYTIK